MADGVFNIANGAFVEKFRDGVGNGGLILLRANEAEDSLLDRVTIADLLSANTEANFTNYARKTGLTGTITIDGVNNRVDVDVEDQPWPGAGGVLDNTLTKAVFYYQESPSDSTRIPLTFHDFAATTDGNQLTLEVNAAGLIRASGPP
jgi:hypothetical protein